MGILGTLFWGVAALILIVIVAVVSIIAYLLHERRANEAQIVAICAHLVLAKVFTSEGSADLCVRGATDGKLSEMSYIATNFISSPADVPAAVAAHVPAFLIRLLKTLNGLGITEAHMEKSAARIAAADLAGAILVIVVESAAGRAAVMRAGGAAALKTLLQQRFMDEKATNAVQMALRGCV